MKGVRIYINGIDSESLGVFFAEKSLTALMTPPPVKPYIENKSRIENGKKVITHCKVDERNVQLTFGLQAPSLVVFISRYRTFCSILEKGNVDITVSVKDLRHEEFRETYYLKYLSCSQYAEFNGRLAKFILKLNEPNPSNRKVEK